MSAVGQEGSELPRQCFSEPKLLLITKTFCPFPTPRPLLHLIMSLVVQTIFPDEPQQEGSTISTPHLVARSSRNSR